MPKTACMPKYVLNLPEKHLIFARITIKPTSSRTNNPYIPNALHSAQKIPCFLGGMVCLGRYIHLTITAGPIFSLYVYPTTTIHLEMGGLTLLFLLPIIFLGGYHTHFYYLYCFSFLSFFPDKKLFYVMMMMIIVISRVLSSCPKALMCFMCMYSHMQVTNEIYWGKTGANGLQIVIQDV